jgi:hypothetical protein
MANARTAPTISLGLASITLILGLSLSTHTAQATPPTCSSLDSSAVFVDSSASDGGDGSYTSPYNQLDDIYDHIEANTTQSICLKGTFLEAELYLDNRDLSGDLTISNYDGATATLNYNALIIPGSIDDGVVISVRSTYSGYDDITSLKINDINIENGGLYTYEVADVTMNNLLINSRENTDGIVIYEADQVELKNIDVNFDDATNAKGIQLSNITEAATVENISISNAYLGMYAYNIGDFYLFNATIENSMEDGIYTYYIDNASLSLVEINGANANGIHASESGNTLITNSYIENTGDENIYAFNINDITIRNSEFHNGDDYLVRVQTSDNTVIENNTFVNTSGSMDLRTIENLTIAQNDIYGDSTYTGNNVYINNVSDTLNFTNNFIRHGGKGLDITGIATASIIHNTFYQQSTNIEITNSDIIEILNNIFSNISPITDLSLDIDGSETSLSTDHNLFHNGFIQYGYFGYDLLSWQALGYDLNSFSGTPAFIPATTSYGGQDLHLLSGSPAKNAGTPTSVTEDIDGATRSTTTPDIGADEI